MRFFGIRALPPTPANTDLRRSLQSINIIHCSFEAFTATAQQVNINYRHSLSQ
jgi:hypothetical protein